MQVRMQTILAIYYNSMLGKGKNTSTTFEQYTRKIHRNNKIPYK